MTLWRSAFLRATRSAAGEMSVATAEAFGNSLSNEITRQPEPAPISATNGRAACCKSSRAVATEHVGQQRTSFHARFINARGIQKLSAQSDCIGNRDRHGFLLAALILYYALYRIGKTVARIGNFRTRRRQVTTWATCSEDNR